MSKPNLPPMPNDLWASLSATQEECVYAYAEEAVRQALAAQVPVAWMTEDGRVSTAETKRTAMPRASQEFFCIPLAIIPEKDHGEST